MRAIDVHGFGGGFTLGTVQAGFTLVAKMSRSVGFGVLNTLGNRHLLGYDWESITGATEGGEPSPEWEVFDADYVFGNPPCSGFSTLSRKDFRGMNSSINDCMWELVRYAAKVKPQIVAWESVQQTFRQGLPLMRELHHELEERSGHKYHLYHVLHNNASLGGVSIRKRYFWVASRVPFGVERDAVKPDGTHYTVDRVPTFGDMLRDLEPLGLTMAEQPYRGVDCACGPSDIYDERVLCRCKEERKIRVLHSSWWNEREVHDGTGQVDGHDILRSPGIMRTLEFIQSEDNPNGVPWAAGENTATVARRYWQKNGRFPESWNYLTRKTVNGEVVQLPKWERLVETDFAMGHNQLTRWHADRMARVITGGACHLVLHPHLDRTLTQREAARIQGFPDAWKIWPVRRAPDLGPGWGKGVPVQAGRWISSWAYNSLQGEPGEMTGVPLQDCYPKLAETFGTHERESVIDLSKDYRRLTAAIGDPG